jgi:hypothetical protein
MVRNEARLDRWLSVGGPAAEDVLTEVRRALDDDLDTAGAISAIDDAVDRGSGVREAAALLGVRL